MLLPFFSSPSALSYTSYLTQFWQLNVFLPRWANLSQVDELIDTKQIPSHLLKFNRPNERRWKYQFPIPSRFLLLSHLICAKIRGKITNPRRDAIKYPLTSSVLNLLVGKEMRDWFRFVSCFCRHRVYATRQFSNSASKNCDEHPLIQLALVKNAQLYHRRYLLGCPALANNSPSYRPSRIRRIVSKFAASQASYYSAKLLVFLLVALARGVVRFSLALGPSSVGRLCKPTPSRLMV